ncbi:hypothetical protein ACFLUX_01220 [Chloroflexota bacterium]
MRLNKTFWITLGVAIIIAASVTLYMLYQGQMREQDELNENLTAANTTLQLLAIEKGALEAQIAQLESDLTEQEGETGELEAEISRLEAELSRLEDERAQAVAQAMLILSEAEAKFLTSAESIEYDEILFGFAHDANLRLINIGTSVPGEEGVDDITYNTTTFNITVWGDVAEILDYIDTIVAYEAFRTSVLATFTMNAPEPLTDREIDELEETIRAELTAQAIAEITTEDNVRFILEAIAEVTGEDKIEKTMTVEEIAALIKERIAGLLGEDIATSLSQDLAGLIEGHINESIMSGLIRDKIVGPLAEEIAALILSGGDMEELLGEDIAELLGEEIAGATQGDIETLLKEYIDNLVEQKKADSVAGLVDDELVAELTAEKVETMEAASSSDITLVIYTYGGE